MMNNKLEFRMRRSARMALLLFAVSAAGLTHAKVATAPVTPAPAERTNTAPGPGKEEAGATPVDAKPCKKKRGGLLGAIKKTGLAGVLTNSAVGGGLGGYAAGQVASVAVDEGAEAEAKAPRC